MSKVITMVLAIASLVTTAGCATQPAPAIPAYAPSRPTAPAYDPAFDGPASGGWVQGSETNTFVDWLNLPGRTRRGNLVRVWTVISYKVGHSSSAQGARSTMTLEEIDCANSVSMTLAIISYLGVNATGSVISSFQPDSGWTHTAPGTVAARRQIIACAR